MGGNFAGSHALDERRRRRLAAGTEQHFDLSEPLESGHDVPEADDQQFDPSTVLLRDVVPDTPWKPAAILVGLLFVIGSVVVAGSDPGVQAGQFGAAVTRLCDLDQGRTIVFLTVGMLVSAAHLTAIVGTMRARSPRDFRGRYRIWRWAAGLYLLAAVLVGTDAHLAFSDLVHRWSGVAYTGSGRLNWLIPLAIASTVVGWKLWIDMSVCRVSQVFLTAGLLSAFALMMSGHLTQQTGYPHVVRVGQLSVGFCLLAASLLHLRFVTHISCDPPVARVGGETPSRPRLRRARRRVAEEQVQEDPGVVPFDESRRHADEVPQPAESAAADVPVEADDVPAAPAPKPASRKSRKKARKARASAPATEQMEELDEYGDFEEPAPRKQSRKAPQNGPSADSLKGLSKKQRRQARKAFREEQRRAG